MYEYNLAESEGFEPSRRFYTAYTISNRAPSASSDSSPAMAPQAGFEPATDRLTADSSTTELLWKMYLCKPGNVLLSQGEAPNYHRRKRA